MIRQLLVIAMCCPSLAMAFGSIQIESFKSKKIAFASMFEQKLALMNKGITMFGNYGGEFAVDDFDINHVVSTVALEKFRQCGLDGVIINRPIEVTQKKEEPISNSSLYGAPSLVEGKDEFPHDYLKISAADGFDYLVLIRPPFVGNGVVIYQRIYPVSAYSVLQLSLQVDIVDAKSGKTVKSAGDIEEVSRPDAVWLKQSDKVLTRSNQQETGEELERVARNAYMTVFKRVFGDVSCFE